MPKFKRRLIFLAVPAVLALGAVSLGSAAAMAATNPGPSTAASPSTPKAAESTTEPAESSTTPEKAEPNEPAIPGGGHADTNDQADTQQEGVN